MEQQRKLGKIFGEQLESSNSRDAGPGSARYARGLIGISVATVARVISRSMFAAVAGGSDFRDRLARGHIPPTLTLSTPAFYPAQLRPDTRLFSSRFVNPCEASRKDQRLLVRYIGYREFGNFIFILYLTFFRSLMGFSIGLLLQHGTKFVMCDAFFLKIELTI